MEDLTGDLVERIFDFAGADVVRGLWHAIDNTRGLILPNRESTGLTHLEEAGGAVPAHPGENAPDRVGGSRAGDRTKQHIDRRPVAGNRRLFVHGADVVCSAALQL